jgi:hypothetical protein
VRRIARLLGQPVDIGLRLHPILAPPPIRELLLYANGLDRQAEGLRASVVASPSVGLSSTTKRLPLRKTTRESEQTVALVEFVRRWTGKKHWDELLVLLKQATGDQGYTKHRLQSLCSFHRQKQKANRRSFLGFFHVSRSQS